MAVELTTEITSLGTTEATVLLTVWLKVKANMAPSLFQTALLRFPALSKSEWPLLTEKLEVKLPLVITGLFVGSEKFKFTLSPAVLPELPPVSEATALINTGPVVSAEMVEVVTAVEVGELVEVTIAFAGRVTVKLSPAAASFQDPLVFTLTKNLLGALLVAEIELLSAAAMMVVPLKLIEFCVPTTKSVAGLKMPSPLSLKSSKAETSLLIKVLEAVLFKFTIMLVKLSPASWLKL